MSIFRRNKSGDERGAFAIVLALSIVPLFFAAGSAVDLSRAYVARSRLSFALDAAGLAVGAANSQDEDELNEILQAYFSKNYPSSAIGDEVDLSMNIQDNIITLSATRRVPATFMSVAGIEHMDVLVTTEVTRETKGLEVALVLDVTGSMRSNGKIGALRSAATSMLNILFGNNQEPESLFVSIVPYTTTVNIGRANKRFVSFAGSSLTGIDATDLANTGTVWKGCVRGRPYPYNVQNEDLVSWPAFTWPMEPRYRNTSGTYSSYCANRSNIAGSNWDSIAETMVGFTDSTGVGTSGPNRNCPNEMISLTNNKQALLNKVSELMPWRDGGTMSHSGIFWGTQSLSPEEPFDEGSDWEDEEWNKAIIIMTDGVNELVQQNSSYCRVSTTQRPIAHLWPNGGPWTHYSGEGYPVDDGIISLAGTTKTQKYNSMLTKMNEYTTEACNYAKSKGIIVYTITFQLSNTNSQNLYRNCATDPSKYFNSPSNEALQQAFRAIGAELSNLRLSK